MYSSMQLNTNYRKAATFVISNLITTMLQNQSIVGLQTTWFIEAAMRIITFRILQLCNTRFIRFYLYTVNVVCLTN